MNEPIYCDDCGLPITELEEADYDGFCRDCAEFHRAGVFDREENETDSPARPEGC